MSVVAKVDQERLHGALFNCQLCWEIHGLPSPQQAYFLQSLKRADFQYEDLLVLASRLNNDPKFVKRFRLNLLGFSDSQTRSDHQKTSQV